MRKFIGSAALVAWMVAYIALVAVLGDRVLKENIAVQVIFFPIAGLAWILPLRPLLKWMHAKDTPHESPDV